MSKQQQTRRTQNSFQRHNVSWGGGETDLFIRVNSEGNLDLLDYQYDYQALHQEFGGKNYYQSRSAGSGNGYLENLGDLIPVGFYRVDTRWPLSYSKEIGEGWDLMLPYHKNQEDKEETLEKNPVVLRRGDQILFVRFKELVNVLPKLLDGGFKGGINHYSDRCQILKRRFAAKEVMFRVYDLYNSGNANFESEVLSFMEYLIPNEARAKIRSKLNKLFKFIEDDLGIFEIVEINGRLYKGDRLEASPLEDPDFLPSGWEPIDKRVAWKRYGTDIKLVCWKENFELNEEFPEVIVPEEELEKFFFWELDIPNVLFQMNRAKYLEQMEKEMVENFKNYYEDEIEDSEDVEEVAEIEVVVVE